MTRTVAIILVAGILVLAVVAGAIAIISTNGDDAPKSRHPSTSERAPEAENHSVGELPAVERAARRFLSGYLPLIYGRRGATVDDLRSATPQLIEHLRNEGGRVTPAQAALHPRLERVTVTLDSTTRALAVAQIKDSPSPAYPLTFQLADTPQGWVVTEIGN